MVKLVNRISHSHTQYFVGHIFLPALVQEAAAAICD